MIDTTVAEFFIRNLAAITKIAGQAYKEVDSQLQSTLGLSYNKYLEQIKIKYSLSKSFFSSNQAVNLYDYYVGTNLSCNDLKIENVNTDKLFKYCRHAIISGTGGCGKSVLMRHLLLDCIRYNQQVPILIELRELNEKTYSLEDLIKEKLEIFGFNLSEKFIESAKKDGQFLLLLDGYDEIDHSIRKKFIKDIKKFISRYENCQTIISTRPEDIFNGIDEFTIFTVTPLTLNAAKDLVKKIPFDTEIKNKFIENLDSGLFTKHGSFLSNALLLSIMLLTYSENAEIPTKLSLFYNQAYEALFHKHDANKGGYARDRLSKLDIQDFSKLFSFFCILTYDKRIFKMTKMTCLELIEKSKKSLDLNIISADYLQDLLSATCLLLEDGLEIAFSHRSFQEYFSALYITTAKPEIQEKLLQRYSNNVLSDYVIKLAFEINQELVEEKLIMPFLQNIFEKMGSPKKIGATHMYKFVIQEVSNITIEKRGFVINFKSQNPKFYLLDFIRQQYNSDNFNPKQLISGLYDKFDDKEKLKEIQISELSQRNVIIQHLLKSGDWLSISYMQTLLDIYKMLIKKHAERDKTIESLLDI